MKLWMPQWLQQDRQATEKELVDTDRRLFLRGLTLTSAGLVVGVPLISIPKPTGPRGYLVVNSPMSDDAVDALRRALEINGKVYRGADVQVSFGGQPLQVESLEAVLMNVSYSGEVIGLWGNRRKRGLIVVK